MRGTLVVGTGILFLQALADKRLDKSFKTCLQIKRECCQIGGSFYGKRACRTLHDRCRCFFVVNTEQKVAAYSQKLCQFDDMNTIGKAHAFFPMLQRLLFDIEQTAKRTLTVACACACRNETLCKRSFLPQRYPNPIHLREDHDPINNRRKPERNRRSGSRCRYPVPVCRSRID